MSIDQEGSSSENRLDAIPVTGQVPYLRYGRADASMIGMTCSTPGGIGDINSDARGSGARFNSGKPPVHLLPLRVSAKLMNEVAQIAPSEWEQAPQWLADAYELLGRFQDTHDPSYLADLVEAVYEPLEYAYPEYEAAWVFDYGRKKYAEWNWAKGMPWSVPVACIKRHLDKLLSGQELDAESGLSHRGHIMCNVLMLRTFIDTYPEGKDLPTTLRPA